MQTPSGPIHSVKIIINSRPFFDEGIDLLYSQHRCFMDKDIGPKVTLGIIEAIVEGTAEFKQWANFTDLEIMEIEGYVPDFNDSEYKNQFTARMKDRVEVHQEQRDCERWL